MRREDDAAGVAGPMFGVQPRVIFRQERIAAVAENGFDEIEIADQVARRKEPNLHRLFRGETRHCRADERAEAAARQNTPPARGCVEVNGRRNNSRGG